MARQLHGVVAEDRHATEPSVCRKLYRRTSLVPNYEFSILLDTTGTKFLVRKVFDFLEKALDCLIFLNIEMVQVYEVIQGFCRDATGDSLLAALALK
jgi:hypothetical protein